MSEFDSPLEEIGEVGEQQEPLPQPSFAEKVKVAAKPVIEKTSAKGKKILTAAVWVAGIGASGGLIYWLGWGEGGKGIWAGKGPLREDANATPDLPNPYNPDVIVSSLDQAYLDEGMEGPKLQIPQIDEQGHIENPSVQMLAAEAGGPSWMLPIKEEDGKQELSDNAAFLAGELAKQLPGVSSQEILTNWVNWHNNPQEFLQFLELHGVPHNVIDWYSHAIELKVNDTTPNDWQDRYKELQEYQPAPEAAPTPHSSEEKPGKAGLAAPAEQEHDSTLEIVARIVEDSLKIEGVAAKPLIAKAVEIAQDLVINHQLPDHDDTQVLLTAAIVAGDRLVKEIEELPREVREVLEVLAHQQAEAAQSVQPDHIFQSPAEAINYVTGGGGIPMLIILGIECGLAAIDSAIYIKRANETRNVPLKSEEELRKDAVSDWLDYEKELDRGMPVGFIPAGKVSQEHSLGITIGNVIGKGQESGRVVVGEVIIDGEQIKTNSSEYQELVKQLKRGIPLNVWNSLESRGLLINQKEKEAVSWVKASDLMTVIQEMSIMKQNRGEILVGEPDWYD